MTLQLRVENIILNLGETKGVEHCPKPQPDTHFMMIEPASTAHTGSTVSDKTVSSQQHEWI
ncbi:hypothetical protein [Pseudoalteromonas sp. NBT06-2]|uniref:hypothetical protein n=1 Tax=Pseudoalteromonas sp. NBT06-2 TaxID=2025950 RepID=UPI002075D47E|nr:hypothetical protein [Pseudoalteromonas sp. NBT06-2]